MILKIVLYSVFYRPISIWTTHAALIVDPREGMQLVDAFVASLKSVLVPEMVARAQTVFRLP